MYISTATPGTPAWGLMPPIILLKQLKHGWLCARLLSHSAHISVCWIMSKLSRYIRAVIHEHMFGTKAWQCCINALSIKKHQKVLWPPQVWPYAETSKKHFATQCHFATRLFSLHTNRTTGVPTAPGLAVSHWLSGERTSGNCQPSADTVDAVINQKPMLAKERHPEGIELWNLGWLKFQKAMPTQKAIQQQAFKKPL